MTRARSGLVLVLLLAACGGSELADQPAVQRIQVDETQLDFGAAFSVQVVRIWERDWQAQPWDEAVLAPLQVQQRDVRVRERGRHRVETRRFQARLFELGRVEMRPQGFEVADPDSGERFLAASEPVVFEVRSILPPGDTLEPELPGGPLRTGEAPWRGGRRSWLAALLFLVLIALLLGPGPRLARAARGGARVTPWERFAELRDGPHALPEDRRRLALNARALARDEVARRMRLPADARCREEILAAVDAAPGWAPIERAALAYVLDLGERARFAEGAPTPAEADRILDELALVLEADAPGVPADEAGASLGDPPNDRAGDRADADSRPEDPA